MLTLGGWRRPQLIGYSIFIFNCKTSYVPRLDKSGVTGLWSGVEWVGKEIDAPAAAMAVPAAAAADQEEPGSSGKRHGGGGGVGGEGGHGAWRHPDVGACGTEEVGPRREL